MSEPESHEYSVSELVSSIENSLRYALDYAKTMDKNESVWSPNSTPGVSLPLSNEVMRLIDSAMRDIWKLKDRLGNDE